MVDWWTQSLLKGLHRNVGMLLRSYPTDGTFNQARPLHRLREIAPFPSSSFSSFDLSAATDRLPVDLQADLLSYRFGKMFGYA